MVVEHKYKYSCTNRLPPGHTVLHYTHVIDVPGADEVKGQIEGLASDLQVCGRQHSHDVHDQLLQHLQSTHPDYYTMHSGYKMAHTRVIYCEKNSNFRSTPK